MILTLIPQAGLPGQAETVLSVAGDVLTVDGVAYDLSPVPEGGEGLPSPAPNREHPFIGAIRRAGGRLHASVIVRLGQTASRDQPVEAWVVTAPDGPVEIPALRMPDPRPTAQEARS